MIIKVLISMLILVGLVGCGNRAETIKFDESDFTIVCLHNHKYMLRISSKAYMVPKFDPVTHLPESCD